MRTFLVVFLPPGRNLPPRIEQVLKPTYRQTLFPQPPVKASDARSASAFPAECALTRSAALHTTPENAGSSAPARCRNGSLAAARAPPRSHPARASPSGWQSSYPVERRRPVDVGKPAQDDQDAHLTVILSVVTFQGQCRSAGRLRQSYLALYAC